MEVNKKRMKYHYFQMKACRRNKRLFPEETDFILSYEAFKKITGITFRNNQTKRLYFRVGEY